MQVMTQGTPLPTVVFPTMAFTANSYSVSAQPSLLPLEVTVEFQVGLVSLCQTPRVLWAFSSFFSNLEATSLDLTPSQQASSGKCHSHPSPTTMAPTACRCLDVHIPTKYKNEMTQILETQYNCKMLSFPMLMSCLRNNILDRLC